MLLTIYGDILSCNILKDLLMCCPLHMKCRTGVLPVSSLFIDGKISKNF